MFASLEKPMAYATFAAAAFCLVWKSPVGIAWIPGIGAGWMGMFTSPSSGDGGHDDDEEEEEEKLAQYPRRPEDEEFWNLIYFVMYGILATAAQYGGLQISKRSITRSQLEFYARVYGLFHLVIGTHHLMWSVSVMSSPKFKYGKLELWRYNLFGSYAGTALASAIMMYNAVQILMVKGSIREICHRKAVLDTTSFCTLISCAFFLIFNMAGIETTFEMERTLWAITMYSLPVVMIMGFLYQA